MSTYHDEDDAIVARLAAKEQDFLTCMFAALADFHEDPIDNGDLLRISRDCWNLRQEAIRDAN